MLGNVGSVETAMLRLKALGVRVALDDFGTGYSSLLYLRRLPFDKLKIDRSFVHSIEKTADAAAVVHAVVSLGHGLGMQVTAEGVETADQQLFLRAAGVHSIQKYRFGRAVTPAEITERLRAARSAGLGQSSALASRPEAHPFRMARDPLPANCAVTLILSLNLCPENAPDHSGLRLFCRGIGVS